MVGWFTPSELLRAGVKAVLSNLFGEYADNREVQAALHPNLQPVVDLEFTNSSGLWFDYVADVGDGFDSTYTVARLLAHPQLKLRVGRNGDEYPIERGQLLIFGGDQVYPAASREQYRNRLTGPYRAALPWADEKTAPTIFAIPGNHDWYDGLTSFLRGFTQQRWIGGWKTRQRRSYFAIALPCKWWLFGIDVQLRSKIDTPQLEFFEEVARCHMEPGSRVILCTAEPSWVYSKTKGESEYRNLRHFEEQVLRPCGHELVVGLAGDLHAYARYESKETGYQRFIAGGGGAYLYPSHGLPDAIEPRDANDKPPRYVAQSFFPEKSKSRRIRWRALAFPFKNWKFAALLGTYYLGISWLVQSISRLRESVGSTFLETLDGSSLSEARAMLVGILRHGPGALFWVVLLVIGFIFFAEAKRFESKTATLASRIALGGAHGLAHVALLLVLMWAFANVNLGMLPLGVDDWKQVGLFTAEMLLLGGLAGGMKIPGLMT